MPRDWKKAALLKILRKMLKKIIVTFIVFSRQRTLNKIGIQALERLALASTKWPPYVK